MEWKKIKAALIQYPEDQNTSKKTWFPQNSFICMSSNKGYKTIKLYERLKI